MILWLKSKLTFHQNQPRLKNNPFSSINVHAIWNCVSLSDTHGWDVGWAFTITKFDFDSVTQKK